MSKDKKNMPKGQSYDGEHHGSRSPQSFHKDIAYDDMKLGDIVGRGAFGIVHKALWKGIQVAVKIMEGDEAAKALNKEVHQLSILRHDNIIRLYGVCSQRPRVCLVMEYAEDGSLYDILHPISQDIKPCEYNIGHVMSWALQCAKAMEYLHGLQPPIIHRDLKPPNMLLKEHGTVLKICDFGTARPQDTSHMTSNKGSAAWMAPEVFEGPQYSEKCDVFSFAIVLWEMITRRKPFDDIGPPPFRIMWAVHSGTRPPLIRGIPKIFEHLMICAWNKDTKIRPPFSAIVLFLEKASKFVSGGNTPLKIPVPRNDEYESSSGSGSFRDTARELSFSSDSTEKVSITEKDTVQYQKKSSLVEKSRLSPIPSETVLNEIEKLTVKEVPVVKPGAPSPDHSGHSSVSPARTDEDMRPYLEQLKPLDHTTRSPALHNFDISDARTPFHHQHSLSSTEIKNLNNYNDPLNSQYLERVSPNLHGYNTANPNEGWIADPHYLEKAINPPVYSSQDGLHLIRPNYQAHADLSKYRPPNQGFDATNSVSHFQQFSPRYPQMPYPGPMMRTPSPASTPLGYHGPQWANRWYSSTIPENSAVDNIEERMKRNQGPDQPGNDNLFIPSSNAKHLGGRSNLEVGSPGSSRSSGTSSPVNALFPKSELKVDTPMQQRIFSDQPFTYERSGPRHAHPSSDSRYEESLWHLIDPEIMPVKPIKNSKESMEIYEDHSRLVQDFINLQKNIEYLLSRKREIDQQLDNERIEQQRSSVYLEEYLRLLEEKQSLSAYLNTLREELESLNRFRATGENVL